MPQQRASMTWRGDAIANELRAAAGKGLLKWAEHVLQQARDSVPLDEGTLSRSGVASVNPGTLEAAVSFDTPYAVDQHENEIYRHAPGREAKYLERPWLESRETAAKLIQRELRRVTRG